MGGVVYIRTLPETDCRRIGMTSQTRVSGAKGQLVSVSFHCVPDAILNPFVKTLPYSAHSHQRAVISTTVFQ
jgi:hypothetical protein